MAAPRIGTANRKTPLFLAFVNTVEDDGKSRAIDSYADGRALLDVLSPYGIGDAHPVPGKTQMAQLHSLRESGYSVLSAMAAKRRPGREEALHIEMVLKSALRDAQFRFSETGLKVMPGPLGGLLDHLALSLMTLLQSPDLNRLRECKRCTHLFLDHGRGQGRRWCSMARCGNRAKADTYKQKQRAIDS